MLAASFGTLTIEHDPSSKQIGFAMAIGILLAERRAPEPGVPAETGERELVHA